MELDPAILHHIEFEAGLSSHIALSDPLITVTKSLITESEARIVEIKTQLETLLSEERLRLGRLKKAIAPYKRLPYELLSRIMKEEKIPSRWDASHNGYTPNTSTLVWIFRQVCVAWRHAALSYHEFWNNLVLETGRDVDHRSRLNFWVQNIGHPSYPISISCRRDATLADLVIDKIVIPYHHSIIHLDTVISDAFSLLPPECFPMLKNLEMHFETKDADRNDPFPDASCFVGMDNLRSLSLFGYGPSIPIMTVPMNRLTSLNLYEPLDLSVIILVLQSCNNTLTHLQIHVIINPTTFTEYQKPHFLLPDLEWFKFCESISGSFPTALQHRDTSLLNYLTLPIMNTLSIDLVDLDVDFPAVPLNGLFERSQCPLRHLFIDSEMDSPLERSELPLDNLPSLAMLTAEHVMFSHRTISRIAAGELIPKIWILNICIQEARSVECLAELIEERARRKRLNGLTIIVYPPMGVNFNRDAIHDFVSIVQPYLDRARRCKGHLAIATVDNDGQFHLWEGNA